MVEGFENRVYAEIAVKGDTGCLLPVACCL